MTVTREDLSSVEGRIERQIAGIAEPMRELITEVRILCQKLDHAEEKYRAIEKNQIDQGKRLSRVEMEVVTIKTRQQGWGSVIERVVYPVVLAALVAFFNLKG